MLLIMALTCKINSQFMAISSCLMALLSDVSSAASCTGYTGSQLVTVYTYSMKARDFALHGHSFKSITAVDEADCFHQCMTECRCVSYNFQPFGERKCELNDEERRNDPTKFNIKPGFNYYEIQTNSNESWPCRNGCCEQSLCQNGGKCKEICGTNRRFKCLCPAGYNGKLCAERDVMAGTCLEVLLLDSRATTGIYRLQTEDGDEFNAFCHMNSTAGEAWTLVMSYSLGNTSFFNDFPLLIDNPLNENSPDNTRKYRLSRARMLSLAGHSTKWRATCDFHAKGMDYRDYIVAGFDSVNPLTYNQRKCEMFDYINIRGSQCSSCTALLKQDESITLHLRTGINTVSNIEYTCDFSPAPNSMDVERSFGWYYSNKYHTDFRCTSNEYSTTEIWFGGNL